MNTEAQKEQQDDIWNKHYNNIIEFKDLYNHLNVPYSGVGQWVKNQRALYKQGTLPNERKNSLEEIDFDFNPSKLAWSRQLELLIEFKNEKGHTCVTHTTSGLGQ